jgi:hypothetical protein
LSNPTLPSKLKNQEPASEEGWGTRFIVVRGERMGHPSKDAQAQADQSIDLLNNQIGRSIGEANPGASMQQLAGAVLDYYHDNGLYTAQQNADGSVSIIQTKLSDEQYAQAREQLGKMDANGYKPEDKKKE